MSGPSGREPSILRHRAAGGLAWSLVGVGLALSGVALGLALATGTGSESSAFAAIEFSFAGIGAVFAVVGALIATRLPRNPIGWLFLVFALTAQFSVFAQSYVDYGMDQGRLLWGAGYIGWFDSWAGNVVPPAALALVFLFFPTGRPPTRRWALVGWLVGVCAAVAALATAVSPGRFENLPVRNSLGIMALEGEAELVATVALDAVVLPLMLAAMLSLWLRLRRARGDERQQIKWFAYAAGLLVTDLVVAGFLSALLGEGGNETIGFALFAVVLAAVPVSVGVAILKYRLYDIDRVINRTIVYGAVTALLALAYFGGVLLIQALLPVAEDSPVTVAASTLAVVALFRPLRTRIQAFVDRRFYRRRFDSAQTIENFAARLRSETDLEALTSDLLRVARTTMQPRHVSLWLRAGELR